jgi:hypothetical protein
VKTYTILRKEGHLNSIMRNKEVRPFKILFYTEWDDVSRKVVSRVEETMEKVGFGDCADLYLCSSWNVPHGFVAFRVAKTPCVVTSRKRGVSKVDYLPHILKIVEAYREAS